MSPLALLGLAGGLCFAFAAVPTAFRTVRAGKHLGTPLSLILSVLGGVVLTYGYLLAAHGFDWVLAVTYGVEGSSWGVLLVYLVRGQTQPARCEWRVPPGKCGASAPYRTSKGSGLCAFHQAAVQRGDWAAGRALGVVK